ncbi:MAG: molybdopterin-guanine dinucleotide biosynthesis protein B, partial [Candidatus Heimdallarchaeota archaeon]
MKIFTIIGYTNSGKTSTLIEIIKELVNRGYNVNSVKHVHIA